MVLCTLLFVSDFLAASLKSFVTRPVQMSVRQRWAQ